MSNFRLSRLLPRFLRGDKDKNAGFTKDAGDKNCCRILFLDDTELKLPLKGSSKGYQLLEKVFDHLNLFEKDYFGVRYVDNRGQTHWLEESKSIASQLKGCSTPYTFYFGVKFYAADPCKLKEEITRYLFFLQVKQDILQGRLPVTFEEAVDLCGYAVQSELGDYDPNHCTHGYVSEFCFVQNQTEDMEGRISAIHKRLAGHVPAVVEYKYLDKVKWLEMYGVDLHPVLRLYKSKQGEGNIEYFLGLTPTGIVVYKNKSKIGNYFWPRIIKVTFKGKIFIIRVKDKNSDEHTYAFELPTKTGCKHLWKCCVEHHAFFRLNQVADPLSRAGKLFRSGSKHRLSGRTERQTHRDDYSRQQPNVLRIPSRRQQRRIQSETRLNAGGSGGYGVEGGTVLTMVKPEPVKAPRHRSLPELQGKESPTSVRSAPWKTNYEGGLYTSGKDSPLSTRSERHIYNRQASDSESAVSRRKYFPNKRGSDNDSEVSAPRRRRREIDSGSESDVSYRNVLQNRRNRVSNDSNIQGGHIPILYPFADKENHPNGSIPSLHSAPGGEQRQRRRRRRSKSPGGKRPPEELRKYIEYGLVDTQGMSEDQMREITYTKIETKAEPFKIKYSPKTRQKMRAARRKSFGESDRNSQAGLSDKGSVTQYHLSGRENTQNRHSGYYDNYSNSENNSSRQRDSYGQVQSSPVVHMQDMQMAPVVRTRNSHPVNMDVSQHSQHSSHSQQPRHHYHREERSSVYQEVHETSRSSHHHHSQRDGSTVSTFNPEQYNTQRSDPYKEQLQRWQKTLIPPKDNRSRGAVEGDRWSSGGRSTHAPQGSGHHASQHNTSQQTRHHQNSFQSSHNSGYHHLPEGPTHTAPPLAPNPYHRSSYNGSVQSNSRSHIDPSKRLSSGSRYAPPSRPSPAPSDQSGSRSINSSMTSETVSQHIRPPGYTSDLCTEL
ncbi:band 4.1-like protein 4 isoform X4 [Haliotis rufescens]|uniref:band 4.1-like protein 4 isoform X4 n=2 Tax=Haliotis rufescens TaxID=6454 RepID=UPI00201F02B7|nr:band 4.1-like protein 4 isoform X4 [Haliotis rufescens]